MNTTDTEATFISFDNTLPVPALPGLLLSRESITTLFSDPANEIRWAEDGGSLQINWIEPGYDWEDDEAETMNRVMVDGVEMFAFTSCPYQFNDDTMSVTALGYAAKWVPGEGYVLSIPSITAEQAAARIIADLEEAFDYGKFLPQHVNSWAEYAAARHTLDRVFYFAGVSSHETAKVAAVAELVNTFLRGRAVTVPAHGTVRADQIKTGDTFTAETVCHGVWSPIPEIWTAISITPQPENLLSIDFQNGHLVRKLTVAADRRFTTS